MAYANPDAILGARFLGLILDLGKKASYMADDLVCYVLPPLTSHGIAPINLFDQVQAIPVPSKYVVAFNPVGDAHLVSHCPAPFLLPLSG
jgi:hypothetical protein